MDAEIVAYAVARAVAEVAPCLPQRFTGKGIYLTAGRAFGEHSHRKVNHSFENKGVVLPFKGGAWSCRNGSGYVRCSGKVLTSRVHKIEPVAFDNP